MTSRLGTGKSLTFFFTVYGQAPAGGPTWPPINKHQKAIKILAPWVADLTREVGGRPISQALFPPPARDRETTVFVFAFSITKMRLLFAQTNSMETDRGV